MTDVTAQARERAQGILSFLDSSSGPQMPSVQMAPFSAASIGEMARDVLVLADAVDAYKDQLGKVVADRAEYRARAEKAEQQRDDLLRLKHEALETLSVEIDSREAAQLRVVDLEAALRWLFEYSTSDAYGIAGAEARAKVIAVLGESGAPGEARSADAETRGGESAIRAVVERYGRVWAKDTDYYAAAEALDIKEPPC